MEKLIQVIGPAPHERTFPSLLELLGKERERMSRVLFKAPKKAKKRAARKPREKKTLSLAQLKMISEATGVSIEDLRRK